MQKYKILFFLTAISQIFSSFFTNFSGGSNFNQLLITPLGYTFSIWGAITIFSSIYAFWHLVFDRHHFEKGFYLKLSFVYICFTLWLMVAERDLFVGTLLVIFAMFFTLLKVFPYVYKEAYRNKWNQIFLLGGTGMYLGWVSIATVLNIAVTIFSLDFSISDTQAMYLQMFFVALATFSALFTLKVARFSKVVFATHWWAFVGLVLALYMREGGVIFIFTLCCVLGLNIFYYLNIKK